MHGVLHVRKEEPLLDDHSPHVVAPHRKPGLESKLRQVAGAARVRSIAGVLASSNLHALAVGEPQLLCHVAQHHDAPERRR